MVPVQPTINIDRPIGMRRASIENNTGKASIPSVNLSIKTNFLICRRLLK